MKKNIVICVSWPYANNYLHLGYIASSLSGDILARYHRAAGDNVLMVSGTDSHGTKMTIKAKNEGVTPKEIATRYHNGFVKTLQDYDFSFDKYSITYSDFHKQQAKEIFKKLYNNGWLYEKTVKRPYCDKCGKFVADTEVSIICPVCGRETKADNCDCGYVPNDEDLKNAKCLVCGSQTHLEEKKVLVFKLSAFKDILTKHLEANEKYWRPNSINETKKYLSDLQDRDFSRDLDWGVEIPIKGYEDKVCWVWYEALLGYLTDTMALSEERGFDWQDFWKSDHAVGTEKRIYMCHAKDNIVFHSLFFPAMLYGLNENYLLPDRMVSAEYLLFNDTKISKSSDLSFAADDYSAKYDTDSLRFYFTLCGPEKKDLNFSIENYTAVHNGEIVNKFGNLVNRTLKFKGLEELPNGVIDSNIIELVKKTYLDAGDAIENIEFKKALQIVIDLISETNKYYDDQKPWVQAKEDREAFNNTIATCAYVIANLSNLLAPFTPKACKKLKDMLNLEDTYTWTPIKNIDNVKLDKVAPLFSRV